MVPRIWPSPPPPPPTQDNGWLSEPPTELCNDLDNHSQQRPDSAGWGKVRTRYLPVKPCTEHCFLLKGLCQNNPLPTPLVLPPQAWSTNPLLGQSLGYPAVPTKMPSPLLFGHSCNYFCPKTRSFLYLWLLISAIVFIISVRNQESKYKKCGITKTSTWNDDWL